MQIELNTLYLSNKSSSVSLCFQDHDVIPLMKRFQYQLEAEQSDASRMPRLAPINQKQEKTKL